MTTRPNLAATFNQLLPFFPVNMFGAAAQCVEGPSVTLSAGSALYLPRAKTDSLSYAWMHTQMAAALVMYMTLLLIAEFLKDYEVKLTAGYSETYTVGQNAAVTVDSTQGIHVTAKAGESCCSCNDMHFYS